MNTRTLSEIRDFDCILPQTIASPEYGLSVQGFYFCSNAKNVHHNGLRTPSAHTFNTINAFINGFTYPACARSGRRGGRTR